MNEMYYLFNDAETGEEFFVVAESKKDAKGIAMSYFDKPHLVEIMTEEESEYYPYDVY